MSFMREMHELIQLQSWPSMPAPLNSRTPGEAWIWGDYVLALQTLPPTIAEIFNAMAGKEVCPPPPISYPFVVSVFYRQARNPHGPSSRPILVAGLEKINYAAYGPTLIGEGQSPDLIDDLIKNPTCMIGIFTASQRFNLGTYMGAEEADAARSKLFEVVAKHLQLTGEPVKIGPIAAIHGHPETGFPAKAAPKKGCFGLLLAVAGVLAALVSGYAVLVSR